MHLKIAQGNAMTSDQRADQLLRFACSPEADRLLRSGAGLVDDALRRSAAQSRFDRAIAMHGDPRSTMPGRAR